MRNERTWQPYLYSLITIACTFLIGQIILWFTPDNADPWSSVLFIFMNLLPLLMAFAFTWISGEISGVGQFVKEAFTLREAWYAYAAALAVPFVYYGVSTALGNVTFTGASLGAALAYFPWALLQGGLEEVGWRWYLQQRLGPQKSFVLKLLILSLIWFVWHFPIYRLPWITAGSSNYVISYLMILGNTFTLGAVKEFSRGSVPCILSHMLINTGAVLMLVGSDLPSVALLAGVEMLVSLLAVSLFKSKHRKRCLT